MASQLTHPSQVTASNRRTFRQPTSNAKLSLGEAYQAFQPGKQVPKPLQVWLLENPMSPIAIPGCCDRFTQDCFHILLNHSTALQGEAFVLGFMMGSHPKTTARHLNLFQFAAQWLYPIEYRFSKQATQSLLDGFKYGRQPRFRNFYRLKFENAQHLSIDYLRRHLELDLS